MSADQLSTTHLWCGDGDYVVRGVELWPEQLEECVIYTVYRHDINYDIKCAKLYVVYDLPS